MLSAFNVSVRGSNRWSSQWPNKERSCWLTLFSMRSFTGKIHRETPTQRKCEWRSNTSGMWGIRTSPPLSLSVCFYSCLPHSSSLSTSALSESLEIPKTWCTSLKTWKFKKTAICEASVFVLHQCWKNFLSAKQWDTEYTVQTIKMLIMHNQFWKFIIIRIYALMS